MAYEKMPCLYETEKDLMDRLGNTVCRYKGTPYLVQVESRRKLNLLDVVSQTSAVSIKPDDPDFDISSAEIGYINWEAKDSLRMPRSRGQIDDGVFYLHRSPLRRYRQGLYPECMGFSTIEGRHPEAMSQNSLFYSKGLVNSMTGSFPSLSEAMLLLMDEKKKEICISQEIAFQSLESGLVLVFCRKKNIGWMGMGEDVVNFKGSRFDWIYNKILNSHGIRTNIRRRMK